jgi:Holliday junction DNA helicase RuvB
MNGLISSLVSIFLASNKHQDQKSTAEEKFFSSVVGYGDLKKLLMKSVLSREPIHVLLSGPPATSKTAFLLDMLNGLQNAFYVDASGASGPGITDRLFENEIRYLLIDEIDKLKKTDQAVLLNVMETGILSETKLNGKTRQKKLRLSVYATSNNVEKLSSPLRSRFMELQLQEYDFKEFLEISCRLLKKRYSMDIALSEKIVDSIWNKMNSKNIRDVIRMGKMVNSYNDIDWLTDVQVKYGKGNVNANSDSD